MAIAAHMPQVSSLEWLTDRSNRWWLHLAFWLFVYLDEILAATGVSSMPGVNMYTIVFFLFVDMATVYFNLYVLVPAFLLTNRIGYFVAYMIISILVNIELLFLLRFQLACIDCEVIDDAPVLQQLLSDFASTSFIVGTAIGANILRRFARMQLRMKDMENNQLRTELDFLKAQINPHFLFNSLNNIYVQTRKRPAEATESVLALSDLMRYQLYDCAQDEVGLDSEINYLKNYLQLEQMRRSKIDILVEIEGSPSGLRVAPFLFMPFVENAVTHGIGGNEAARIFVKFTVSADIIIFEIENTKPSSPSPKKDGGIGLTNGKRRLELLYRNRHHLVIDDQPGQYRVKLTLELR